MATTLRITLLAGTYGAPLASRDSDAASADQLDYPPSPWLLLQVLRNSNPELTPLLARLASQPPLFHLPYGQLEASRPPVSGKLSARSDPSTWGPNRRQ